jgi:hypothetical protein
LPDHDIIKKTINNPHKENKKNDEKLPMKRSKSILNAPTEKEKDVFVSTSIG